jgi:hypothetical protein
LSRVVKAALSRFRLALPALPAFALVWVGCQRDEPDFFLVAFDAGVDAAVDDAGGAEAIDETLGGPCNDDAQCSDDIPCTYDACDRAIGRCRHVPDDAQCDDGQFCNGREICKPRRGCLFGPPVVCRDDNPCTIDRCVEETKSCARSDRDLDGDGDPDGHCFTGADCDDLDPTVGSSRTEICGNFKDDDCDGDVDEPACSVPAHDRCGDARIVTAAETLLLSTIAAGHDYATSCSVAAPLAARDIVLALKVPPGDARDVIVRAVAPASEVAVALRSDCEAGPDLACGNVRGAQDARAIVRSAAGGSTLYAILTTQSESQLDVSVDFAAATTKPTNETCASATPVAIDRAFLVRLFDANEDLASDCRSGTGELTYRFTTTEPSDVSIYATTALGLGRPVLGLLDTGCTAESRCRATGELFARNLPAGTHVLAVSGMTQLDADVVITTAPPTPVPPDQSCTSPPLVTHNETRIVDLTGHEDAIDDGCLGGVPNAAYRLVLTEPSDVLAYARFEPNDVAAVALVDAACTRNLACSVDQGQPARVSRRNLPAGEYRIVVGAERSRSAKLTILVRPTVVPVTVAGDTCADPQVIPSAGGYFVGTTANANATFNAGCDALGQPNGGAKDRILRLPIAARSRLVVDMTGSTYTTLLDVRRGEACPGTEVEDGCSLGFIGSRSFEELLLDPGTYWIQVDGYAGSSGDFALDVRVVPP